MCDESEQGPASCWRRCFIMGTTLFPGPSGPTLLTSLQIPRRSSLTSTGGLCFGKMRRVPLLQSSPTHAKRIL